MRRVRVAERWSDANAGKWAYEATFHQFSQSRDGESEDPVAIVEKDDGRIAVVGAGCIQFVVPQQSPAGGTQEEKE